MGFDLKYGVVTTEHGEIPDDEPVIVFRARDVKTLGVLTHYLKLCDQGGSPDRHLRIIAENLVQFARWQEGHPGRLRIPDSERSRAWLDEGSAEPG
jgi:hypothetical protein